MRLPFPLRRYGLWGYWVLILHSASAGTVTVTTTADEWNTPSGANVALREAVRDALAGDTIIFAPTLSGQTLALTGALGGEIVLGKNLTINASSLPGGITINGGAGTNRIFSVSPGQNVALTRLTLTGGNGTGTAQSGNGGAIFLNANATLSLTGCTLAGNSVPGSSVGGAILNEGGTLALTRCTLANNSADSGGAVYSATSPVDGPITSSTTLIHCTLSGNSAALGGGAVFNGIGRTTLTHCTVSGNSAPINNGGGVASYGLNDTETVVRYTVIAGNAAGDIDLWDEAFNSFTSGGGNLVGTGGAIGDFNQPGDATGITNPQLAAPGDYGGATQTMALLPGSPARNAATGSTATSDQRGFPVVGVPDAGAYEAGNFRTFNAWAVETAGSALAFNVDHDNDGCVTGFEYALRRAPLAGDAPLSPTLAPNGGGHLFQFRYRADARDLRYIVQRSSDLANPAGWTEIYRYDASTSEITKLVPVTATENPITELITVTDPATGPRQFWRLRIERVQ